MTVKGMYVRRGNNNYLDLLYTILLLDDIVVCDYSIYSWNILVYSKQFNPRCFCWQHMQEYFNMLTSGYKVWPIVQVVNFYAIPLRFRYKECKLMSMADVVCL